MTTPAAITQAAIQRLIRAAKAEGVAVMGYEVRPDGAVRVLTGEPQEAERDDLAEWRARRDQRKTSRTEPRRQAAR